MQRIWRTDKDVGNKRPIMKNKQYSSIGWLLVLDEETVNFNFNVAPFEVKLAKKCHGMKNNQTITFKLRKTGHAFSLQWSIFTLGACSRLIQVI